MAKRAKQILVVVAHPDDEVLGCGGTIAKHVGNGDKVNIIVLADGVTSRYYKPDIARSKEIKKCKKLIEMRRREFFAAAKVLGIAPQNCHLFDLPDQRLDALSILDIIQRIEKYSEKIDPDIIYTHFWGDINKDHRVCYEAVRTAYRRSLNQRQILCFEVPGNIGVRPGVVFKPNKYSNVSLYIHSKITALKAYRSETKAYPSPISSQGVLKLASSRGRTKGMRYAEAFLVGK